MGFNAQLLQIFRKLLRHSFGQGGYQRTLTLIRALFDFFKEVVDLMLGWADFDHGIEKSSRAD